jgi:hypothetical protein
VDGLQSEALNSLDATYVFVRQSAIDGLLFDNKNATKTSFFYAEGILIMAIRIRMLL